MNHRLLPLFIGLLACHGPSQIIVPTPSALSPQIEGDVEPTASPKATSPISCEAAVQQVLTHHPALTAARAGQRVEWAEGEAVPRAGTFEVRVRDEMEALGDNVRAGIRWRLPVPGRESARVAAANERVQMSVAEIKGLETALAQDIRMAHLAVRRARTDMAFSSREATLMVADAQWRQTRVKAGMETEISAHTAMLKAREARQAEATAKRTLFTVETAFAEQTGRTADDARCGAPPEKMPIATHPTVSAALSRARAIGEEVRAERADGVFWPRFLEITWDRESGEADRTFLEIGIPISFTGPALRAREAASVVQAKAQLQAVVNATHREITLAEADLAARIAERDAIPEGETVSSAQAVAARADDFGGDPRQRSALRRALLREEIRRHRLILAVETAEIRLRAARGHP